MIFHHLPSDLVCAITAMLPNSDRLNLAETCRDGRAAVREVGLRGDPFREIYQLAIEIPSEERQSGRLQDLLDIQRFARGLDGELGEAARSLELTAPQHNRVKNAFALRHAPSSLARLAQAYPHEILYLGRLSAPAEHGPTDYVDWLRPADVIGPVCWGHDERDRAVLTLRIGTDRQPSGAVAAYFQRFSRDGETCADGYFSEDLDLGYLKVTPFAWVGYAPDSLGKIWEGAVELNTHGQPQTWIEAMEDFLLRGEIETPYRTDFLGRRVALPSPRRYFLT